MYFRANNFYNIYSPSMNHLFKTSLFTFLFFICFLFASHAQYESWFLEGSDSTNGANVQAIYEKNMILHPQNKVIVAVLDGGVDPTHEDLKNVMWVNPGEIPGNRQDDDHNGYIDDIHGWNFLGSEDGQNVDQDTYEVTREFVRLHKKFKDVNPDKLKRKEKKEYELYLSYQEKIEEEAEKAESQYNELIQQKQFIVNFLHTTEAVVGQDNEISEESVKRMKEESKEANAQVLAVLQNIVESTGQSFNNFEAFESFIMDDIEKGEKHFESKFKYGYNPDFEPRPIVGDNYDNTSQRYYGNNDIAGPDAFHGTHVAGIIGAERDNGIGIDGISNQVEIMGVRMVPDGDERDKDVANGIIYAVDNGAKVINMSFGKGISPEKRAVDKAVKYAMTHDVLLVHAAGNESKNTDEEDNFPNNLYDKRGICGKKKYAEAWLEVGALARKTDNHSIASFSNYGQNHVDIFAPGHQIYSTAPDNEYKMASGTSMAAPVVAGVAAIIRANFPSLSAQEVKEIIMESGDEITIPVIKPGTDEEVDFSTLSVSGKRINAKKAYLLAAERAGK